MSMILVQLTSFVLSTYSWLQRHWVYPDLRTVPLDPSCSKHLLMTNMTSCRSIFSVKAISLYGSLLHYTHRNLTSWYVFSPRKMSLRYHRRFNFQFLRRSSRYRHRKPARHRDPEPNKLPYTSVARRYRLFFGMRKFLASLLCYPAQSTLM